MATSPFDCRPPSLAYDFAIVGGTTSGSAIAWFLTSDADFHGTVLVMERDPSLRFSATQASNNCMHQQFATEINVKVAQYGAEFVKNFRKNLGSSDDNDDDDGEDQKLQAACGAGTHMLSTEEIVAKYPFFALDDIEAGSLNTVDEVAFDALGMVDSLETRPDDTSITLKTGEVVSVGTSVVNAAGNRAAHVFRLAGVHLPIEARRRYTFVFSVAEPLEPCTSYSH